ncbi:MAG: 4-(cytidine 5'-diphospho)-2-C-methyl-D-erythritol kinase [Flavobacteriales bacterium]|nr:4-(cytidine 5'-diphospho)-2-C-methyl-D-erythritol kinase [Flavobacteriales bacterium]|tara:strand:- start:30985 stop:31797 length:813 start_codon:yes stop_codon:yes gene_type:complete
MLVFPNAKINLGLNILSRRPDGYHNIESVFIPIPIKDALEITLNTDQKTNFSSYGIEIPSDGKPNLVVRAWALLREDFNIPHVDFDLLKNIPIGAGLGGGSSNAAACIRGLNELFNLKLSEDKLLKLASKLGADCAFFVQNKPVFAQGIGNQFNPININLSQYHFVVIFPNIHVSTPEAYKHVTPSEPQKNITDILKQPLQTWKSELKNDFEPSVFKQYPKIADVKNALYNAGALYASMSGSGSTLFGIFKTAPGADFNQYGKVWSFKGE